MNFKNFFISYLIVVSSFNIYGQNIDIEEAEKYFREYEEICHIDKGNLWGISLHGPLMFVERESRTIVANTAGKKEILKKRNGVYQGHLPVQYGIANTTFYWNGMQWTMVLWPVSNNRFERNQLIFHESFHSAQIKLDLNMTNTENPHLDTKDGRIWLQLEWLALLRALLTSENKESIQDALIFRKYRRSLFQNSDSTENALELLEGIPEYTGIKLSGRDSIETIEYLSEMVTVAQNRASFYRTFPYTSGPLYCFLIERNDYNWRQKINEMNNLGDYIKSKYSISIPENLKSEAEKRAMNYGGLELIKKEMLREKEIVEKKKNIISIYIDGPVLFVPIKNPNIEFNPMNMMAVDDKGTYYKTLRLVDVWGILEVEKGALITQNWTTARVMASEIVRDNNMISGKGWKLKLNEGWDFIKAEQAGNYTLIDQGK